jgi:hypothetical protein
MERIRPRGTTCLLCKSFYFDPGEPAYSECTPGSDMSIGCMKVWSLDGDDTEDTYREKMLSAEWCEDYEVRK